MDFHNEVSVSIPTVLFGDNSQGSTLILFLFHYLCIIMKSIFSCYRNYKRFICDTVLNVYHFHDQFIQIKSISFSKNSIYVYASILFYQAYIVF